MRQKFTVGNFVEGCLGARHAPSGESESSVAEVQFCTRRRRRAHTDTLKVAIGVARIFVPRNAVCAQLCGQSLLWYIKQGAQ